jgi:SulP family sulfate permease
MKSLTKRYIHLSKNDAIADIVPTLDQSICASCQVRIFRECPEPPEPPEAPETQESSDTGQEDKVLEETPAQ